MIRRRVHLRAAGIAIAAGVALAGCPPTKPSEKAGPESRAKRGPEERSGEQTIVAEVNGEQFTLDELERRIDGLPPYVRAKFRGPAADGKEGGSVQKRQEYLTGLVQFEVLADVAEARGVDAETEFRHLYKEELADRAIREALRTEISMSDISNEAIERAYRENIDQYRTPEKRRVLAIATDAKSRARRLREELTGDDDASFDERLERFRTLASASSVDPVGARSGGRIGAIQPPGEEQNHPDLAEIAYDLDERGEISEVREIDGRWYLVMWSERREASTTPLAQVEREIRNDLYEKRRAELRDEIVAEWRRAADVTRDEELVDRLEKPPAGREVHVEEIPLVSTSEIDEP